MPDTLGSFKNMHDMFFCHICKTEPSIVATFRFEHELPGRLGFSGSMGMHTDSNDVILQTFFAVTSVCILIKLKVLIKNIFAECLL